MPLATIALLMCSPTPLAAGEALTVGIFPRRAQDTTQAMFTPLADYLSGRLGRPVRLETAPDFIAFWDAASASRYDLLHLNQYHYVRLHKELGYRVIAKNEEFGRSEIAGTLVVRADSGINYIHDLKGKKIIFGGGRTAMISYIVAKHLLQNAGLGEGDYISQFALNPPRACEAVYHRQGAAAGIGDVVLEMPSVREKINVDEMKLLYRSKPLSHLPWAVKPTLPPSLAIEIQTLLVDLKNSPTGKAILRRANLTGLATATDGEYDSHREIIFSVSGERY